MIKKCVLRRYTLQDIPKIVEIIARVIPLLPNYKGATVDETFTRYQLQNNVNNDCFFIMLLCDAETDEIVGGISAWAAPIMFSTQVAVMDRFLYIKDEYRSMPNATALIRSFVKWGQARNPFVIIASHTSGFRSGPMDGLLKREGFVPVGTIYHWHSKENGK